VTTKIRNIAIIAHVDHGKTTLVDKLLQQSGSLDRKKQGTIRIMDSNVLEQERGITILAKHTAINWNEYHINIVDTPGHADFGGEVERVLSMVDAVLLLVDATDGPMPQTRFVTQKAFAQGLHPIVVINKVDRASARPEWVVDAVFDLFDSLGATEEQLDFPVIYASALDGYAMLDMKKPGTDMQSLFETIVKYTPEPVCDPDGPFQMQISSLDYSSYVGTIGIGRVTRGTIKPNTNVTIVGADNKKRSGRVLQLLGHLGLEKIELQEARAGDIIEITGIDPLSISDTVCDPSMPELLTPLIVDEPTMSMTFQVNTSPFAGLVGKFVTSRQIRERLETELKSNVALKVEDTDEPDKFKVSGRGELHLSILIETMRREGYELGLSRPEVIFKEVDGVRCEPFEELSVDIEEAHQGAVMESLGARKGDLKNMMPLGQERVRLEYIVPSRGIIGFHSEFSSLTRGTGICAHVFDHYGPVKMGEVSGRKNGVMISNAAGKATAYSLWQLQPRGKLIIGPQTDVYEGMIVGVHSRDNDLVVNVIKGKQLTNVRASGTDEKLTLSPPIQHSLESAIEFIQDDELVEVTPKDIRLRKKKLKESERKRSDRS
jgi:GTP-binding protein